MARRVTRSQTKAKFEKGQMIPEHFELWIELQEFLINEFKSDPEDLMRKFISNKIIDTDDKEKVRREIRNNYDKGGATKLVEILGERGEMVLPRIIETLKPNYGKVATRLEQQLRILKDGEHLADLKAPEEKRYKFPVQESGR